MAYDDARARDLCPEYSDAALTRAQERRKPSLDMIAKGAILLDLEYRVIEDKSYPSDWPSKRGCVRVEKGKMKKSEILPKIGEILVKNQK